MEGEEESADIKCISRGGMESACDGYGPATLYSNKLFDYLSSKSPI